MTLCQRCMLTETEDNRILSEIAHSRKRSLHDLLRQAKYQSNSLSKKAERKRKERLENRRQKQAEYEQRLKEYEEKLSYQVMQRILQDEDIGEIAQRILRDKRREELEQKVNELKYQPGDLSEQDLIESLKEHIERGDLDLEKQEIKITPKGARKLANRLLRRSLEKLSDRQPGTHGQEEMGYGVERSPNSRKYEIGDEYDKVDFEKTLLNALEKKTKMPGTIELEPGDFHVYEEIHQTKMVAGLIVDESESMSGDKINAAIDTSLALAELVKKEPKDLLKVYLFSEQVREVPYYDILNTHFSGGSTDIRAALRAFRKDISNEKGDKQAYLITDSEPNTEDGIYVGFNEATPGMIAEALEYRKAGITLNIIMLDQNPQLKELASIMARKNLGRVFFTSPLELGGVVIEDYLATKKRGFNVF